MEEQRPRASHALRSGRHVGPKTIALAARVIAGEGRCLYALSNIRRPTTGCTAMAASIAAAFAAVLAAPQK
jgi:hypothetical protein